MKIHVCVSSACRWLVRYLIRKKPTDDKFASNSDPWQNHLICQSFETPGTSSFLRTPGSSWDRSQREHEAAPTVAVRPRVRAAAGARRLTPVACYTTSDPVSRWMVLEPHISNMAMGTAFISEFLLQNEISMSRGSSLSSNANDNIPGDSKEWKHQRLACVEIREASGKLSRRVISDRQRRCASTQPVVFRKIISRH